MNGTSSEFFSGLTEHHESSMAEAVNAKNITMLRCLRWAMKTHNMNVEFKRADVFASTMITIQLVKYDKDMRHITTRFDVAVKDSRIEKGLWELEGKILQSAGLKPTNGFGIILEMLRRNKISVPPHEDLRNEIIMKGRTIRIGYMGTDPSSGEDLFSGSLLLDNEIIVRVKSQKRIGLVLDNLENALFIKRRENSRKDMDELMFKLGSARSVESAS